jgi:hypothetical protein
LFERDDIMRALIAASALLLAASVCSGARADHAPGFVVPGKAGVPIFINGYDASWGVVEGDWGLHRPGHMRLTVTYAPHVIYASRGRGYHPYTGRTPRRGRLEIQTTQRLRPADSFHRVWSTQPDRVPVIEYPPFDPPPVILAPRSERPLSPK